MSEGQIPFKQEGDGEKHSEAGCGDAEDKQVVSSSHVQRARPVWLTNESTFVTKRQTDTAGGLSRGMHCCNCMLPLGARPAVGATALVISLDDDPLLPYHSALDGLHS